SRMTSVASTKTGGTGTGNPASVADIEEFPENEERPGRLAGPLLICQGRGIRACLVRLVVGLISVVRVRVRIDGRAGLQRLPLPRLAVLRGRRDARIAGAVAAGLRSYRVDRQAGEVDLQGTPGVVVVQGDAGDGLAGQRDGQHVDDGRSATHARLGATGPDVRRRGIGERVDGEAGAGPPLADVAADREVGALGRPIAEGKRDVADDGTLIPPVGVVGVQQQEGAGRAGPRAAEGRALAIAEGEQIPSTQVKRMAAQARAARRGRHVERAERDGRLGTEGYRRVLGEAHDARGGEETGRENETFRWLGEDGGVHVAYCKFGTLRAWWRAPRRR